MARQQKESRIEAAFAAGIGIPPRIADPPCRGMGELFFPSRTRKGWEDYVEVAQSICATCPHADPCRTAAQERKESDGVWGGWDAWADGVGRQTIERAEARKAARLAEINALRCHTARGNMRTTT